MKEQQQNPLTFLLADEEVRTAAGRNFEALVSELKRHPGAEAKMQIVTSPVTDPAAGFRTTGEYLVACVPGTWRYSPPQSDSPSYALRVMQGLYRMGGFGYMLTNLFLGGEAYVVFTEAVISRPTPVGLSVPLVRMETLGILAPTIWEALESFRRTEQADKRREAVRRQNPFGFSPFGPFGPSVHMINNLDELREMLGSILGGDFEGFGDPRDRW